MLVVGLSLLLLRGASAGAGGPLSRVGPVASARELVLGSPAPILEGEARSPCGACEVTFTETLAGYFRW
jgi:hypothetical protein